MFSEPRSSGMPEAVHYSGKLPVPQKTPARVSSAVRGFDTSSLVSEASRTYKLNKHRAGQVHSCVEKNFSIVWS